MSQTKYCLAAALCVSFNLMWAVPARQSAFTFLSADGTRQIVRLCGDENFHYYVSADDGALLVENDGCLVPADLDAEGKPVPSDTRVKASARARALRESAEKRRRSVPGLVKHSSFPATGKQKIAVVLVEYQDVKFNLPDPNDYFTRMLNEKGFSDYYATGSARDWFMDSSGGMFEPEFDVFGPVTLQKHREYYGGNDAWGQDLAPQKMVIEACRQLNATVDFSEYDRDGDGYIDNVFVVYAGRGAASGGGEECVWPHAWTLTSAEPGMVYTFDGARLDRYACCNEWELSDQGHGYRPVGIGTFVHEFAHVMGLPDLYSTKYVEGSYTPGAWSVMDYGPYNNDGCTPPQFSAWERASLGYHEPTSLPSSGNIAIPPLEQGTSYIIPTTNDNEFFILENRQQNGWDSHIPGHGMLVWHIDYDEEVWSQNVVNNNINHNYVDIIEADGMRENNSRAGDPFPGAAGVTALSATTTPALASWNGSSTGAALTDITEIGERLVFRLNGGAPDIAAPSDCGAIDVAAGAFTATWQPVAGAIGYIVKLYSDDELLRSIDLGADASSVRVDGLEPSTDYRFTVAADDGFFGSGETQAVAVRTLDPTFDYFAPEALDAAEVKSTSFLAMWEPMAGATEYFVDVYHLHNGEPMTTSCDFTDMVNNLPDGWNTNSSATYGMASYSGIAAPSLRLSRDGDEFVMKVPHPVMLSLSFWHRGNGTSPEESLSVLGKFDSDDAEWVTSAIIPITTEKGGATIELSDFPQGISEVKIVFNRQAGGAVAIDDVTMLSTSIVEDVVPGYDRESAGNATSLLVSGLEPGSTYCYTVSATDGVFNSLLSKRITVVTRESSSIAESAVDTEMSIRLNGLNVTSSQPISIYTASGAVVATDVTCRDLPSAGLYFVVPRSGKAIKVLAK